MIEMHFLIIIAITKEENEEGKVIEYSLRETPKGCYKGIIIKILKLKKVLMKMSISRKEEIRAFFE